MSDICEKLSIREAGSSDYDEIMKIGEFLYGFDFVASMYHQYLTWYHCYVGIIEGQIIAFNAGKIVDGGKTMITSGARVKAKLQGQGIMGQIIKHIVKKLRHISPELEYDCLTATSETTSEHEDKILRNYKYILKQINCDICCKRTDFNTDKINPNIGNDIQEIRYNRLKEIFYSPTSQWMFPDHRIVADWSSYRLLEENIPSLLERFGFWESGHLQSTVISVAETYVVKDRLNYCLNFYGSDSMEIRNHIAFHIQRIPEFVTTKCDDIMLSMLFPEYVQNPGQYYELFKSNCNDKAGQYAGELRLYERQL
ncbi:hypothetical protein LOTGIDRAFT_171335 [Lottia gigantea]|uniref:N-acetyltransferase domain-containing protein n=1 Tax=Lottia gigantea TaxID=225164 RepID=V4B7H2_LOTGI|nr:hypothetical protein LOTGIDRAFT_171335 [Lottia gigantea]ESP03541.1 hypothetical protein LOTGIDRAFT_171335 [Lottia gigantea]